MNKRQFRIGELAKALSVENYVIRFWEKEFGISSTRSQGGQRFYTSDDMERFKLIKELLYEKGFTIAGARHQLTLLGKAKVTPATTGNKENEKLLSLRKKLRALKQVLQELSES